MIDEGDYGAIGGMKIGRGNRVISNPEVAFGVHQWQTLYIWYIWSSGVFCGLASYNWRPSVAKHCTVLNTAFLIKDAKLFNIPTVTDIYTPNSNGHLTKLRPANPTTI
jgi:hypothetical protein